MYGALKNKPTMYAVETYYCRLWLPKPGYAFYVGMSQEEWEFLAALAWRGRQYYMSDSKWVDDNVAHFKRLIRADEVVHAMGRRLSEAMHEKHLGSDWIAQEYKDLYYDAKDGGDLKLAKQVLDEVRRVFERAEESQVNAAKRLGASQDDFEAGYRTLRGTGIGEAEEPVSEYKPLTLPGVPEEYLEEPADGAKVKKQKDFEADAEEVDDAEWTEVREEDV